MHKIVNPCTVAMQCGRATYNVNAYAEITYKDGKLSIHGVVGPLPSGNCRGSAGQCQDEIRSGNPAAGWTREMLGRFCDVWNEWHLNDLRPYCEHQKALGWDKIARKKVEIRHISANAWSPNTTSTELLGWLRPSEHPDGLLCKPCPVCGYEYGTAWKTDPIPQDVIDFLESLPESKRKPAWV